MCWYRWGLLCVVVAGVRWLLCVVCRFSFVVCCVAVKCLFLNVYSSVSAVAVDAAFCSSLAVCCVLCVA